MTRKARRAAAGGGNAALQRLLAGDPASADALAQEALARNPNDATALQVRGVAAYGRDEHSVSEGFFRRVVELDPENFDGQHNLAESLKRQRRYAEAIPHYRAAMRINPRNLNAWINFAFILVDQGQYGGAAEACRAALGLDPNSVAALQNLSISLWASGYVAEGIETIRRALALDGNNTLSWSNLLMFLQYSADHSEEELLEAARGFGETMRRPAVGPSASVMPEPTRLRIGYVSGDLCDHPVGYQIETILESHDRNRFEVFLYSTSGIFDATTARLSGLTAGWRDLSTLDDEAAARVIAEDGVHVLIDLSGHTARHRLGVFAHRPAPVQASWLGYFATSGLPTMDFILRDGAQIPQAEERYYTERVQVIENAAFGYRPLAGCPELSPLPARTNGNVTFANFSNPAKISAECVQAWARVLNAVPGSRMIVDRKGLDEPVGRDRLLALFAEQGVSADRLDIGASRGHLAYMARYSETDVVLDSFPCNGATTTYEALWMGVPVVSRRWSRMVGHFAESILAPLGYAEWVSDDEAGFVANAVALAGDLDRLEGLRSGLRAEMAASSLCQAGDCAFGLERAYEAMWRKVRAESPVASPLDVAGYLARQATARPDDAGRWLDLAPHLARLGRVTDAFAAFERGAGLDPVLVSKRGGEVFAEFGDALAAQGRLEEAVVCFAESVKINEGIADPAVVHPKALRMLEKAAA